MKFSTNLKKTIWKFERAMETNREVKVNYTTIKKTNSTKNLGKTKIFEKRLRKIISEKFDRCM